MEKRRILIVEDDSDLSSTILKFLTLKSYECLAVQDGQEAVDVAYEHTFDLIIMDVKLPSMNGFEASKLIREFSNTPIIFLTSLDSQKDVEKGFMSGGDDYITKPFSLNELLLRIQAVLRRLYQNKEMISIADNVKFDTVNMTLYKDGSPAHLTEKEVKLLSMFLQHPGKIFTRDEIFDAIYDYNEESNEASLRVFINRLRKLIGKEKIETLKNIGYRYVG